MKWGIVIGPYEARGLLPHDRNCEQSDPANFRGAGSRSTPGPMWCWLGWAVGLRNAWLMLDVVTGNSKKNVVIISPYWRYTNYTANTGQVLPLRIAGSLARRQKVSPPPTDLTTSHPAHSPLSTSTVSVKLLSVAELSSIEEGPLSALRFRGRPSNFSRHWEPKPPCSLEAFLPGS